LFGYLKAFPERKKKEIKNSPEVAPVTTPKKRGRPPKKAAKSTDVVQNPRTKKSKLPPKKEKKLTTARSRSTSRTKKIITSFAGNPQEILWNKLLEFPGFAYELGEKNMCDNFY